jgi:protein-tyrosine phosphatase
MGPPPRPGGRPSLSVVWTDLLVGEYPAPGDAGWLLSEHGVTAVLSLQDDADLASKGLLRAALEEGYRTHGLKFRRIPVPDGDDRHLLARLDEIVAVLGDWLTGGERVYLHCNAGLNRAPTAAIAYLRERAGLALEAARDHVKRRRPCVPYMQALERRYRGR